jgi:hypothetical protein
MHPDSSDNLYDEDDDPPTIPRGSVMNMRASGTRPASQDLSADEEDIKTDVDAKTLPAADEETTAHCPADVEHVLRGISSIRGGQDDTETSPTLPSRRDDRS